MTAAESARFEEYRAYAQGYADAMADAGMPIHDSAAFAESYAANKVADIRYSIADAYTTYANT